MKAAGRSTGKGKAPKKTPDQEARFRELQQSLESERTLLLTLIDNVPDLIFQKDRDSRFVLANRSLANIVGLSDPREMIGRTDADVFRSEIAEKFMADDRTVIETGRTLDNIEEPVMSAAGTLTWVLTTKVPLLDRTGRVSGLVGIGRDISDRKKAEEALRESEERYRNLVENLAEGLAIIDRFARLRFANPAAEKIFGVPVGGLTGVTAAEHLGEERVARMLAEIARAPKGEKVAYTLDLPRSDGQVRTIAFSVSPQFDVQDRFVACMVAFHDITEQRLLAASLEQERKLLLTLINNLPDYIYLKDGEGRFILVNQAQARLVGSQDPRELQGRRDADFVARELAEKYRADDLRVMSGAKSLVNIEEQNQDESGARRWVLTTKVPLVGLGGEVTGLVGISRDITERKNTEEALRRSEQKYHLLLDTLNEGVWAIDKDDVTTFVNPRMAAMMGYSGEELLGRNIYELLDAPLPEAERSRAVGRRRGITGQLDGVFLKKDGTRIFTRLKAAPILGEGGEYLGSIASVVDISEQRRAENEVQRLESQLLQAQKMEAIGRLAGGVAHDFNNLLTTILGNVELIKAEGPARGTIEECAEEIQRAGMRAAELTHQLLAFSRKQMLQPKVLDMNGLVENLSKMLRRLIGEDIALELRLGAGLGRVRADPGQLEQVILNLAVNARDAMSRGGRLVLETRNSTATEAFRPEHFEIPAGRYVILMVSDTGVGMEESVKAHLFEPFFTTKERGKGTGLGLSTVYGIVKQSDGYIFAESEPGRGAVFTILLPRMEGEDTAGEESAGERRARGGTERIIVVEDEPSVLHLATRMLESFGYTVIGARTPGEALSLQMTGEAAQVDLLVTDVVLSEMNGTELARRMQDRSPGLRVLFISGYTDERTFREQVLTEGDAFLPKPFTKNLLGMKVREVLDSRSP
jgi:two-component system, cell cycle sensor histidine kinase and response regulator CckA